MEVQSPSRPSMSALSPAPCGDLSGLSAGAVLFYDLSGALLIISSFLITWIFRTISISADERLLSHTL